MIPHGGETLRGEPQDFRIPRTGDRDLAFRGWLLSHAEERGGSPGATRGVDIDIYLTIRLRLAAHVCRWSLQEGEGLREEHRVAAHDSAAKGIEWLKQENAGRLDAPRQRGLVRACPAGPGLRGLPQLPRRRAARRPPRQHALPPVQRVLRNRVERREPRCGMTRARKS